MPVPANCHNLMSYQHRICALHGSMLLQCAARILPMLQFLQLQHCFAQHKLAVMHPSAAPTVNPHAAACVMPGVLRCPLRAPAAHHAQNDVGRGVLSTPGKPTAALNHCTFSSTSETNAIGTCSSGNTETVWRAVPISTSDST